MTPSSEQAEVTRTYGEGEGAVHALRGVSLEIDATGRD